MEILKNPRFDFLGKKIYFITISIIVIVAGLISWGVRGIPLGIDFRGGANVQLKFRGSPPNEEIRRSLEAAGFGGLSIQRIGKVEDKEILIRMDPTSRGARKAGDAPREEEDLAADLLKAVRSQGELAAASGKVDLNTAGAGEIRRSLLSALGPGSENEAERAAAAIAQARNEHGGLISDLALVRSLPEVTPGVASWLAASAITGPFSIVSIDYVGPAVGSDLRTKARWAVILSLIAMLIYIAYRFKAASYGVSAIVTLGHDVLVTLGFISFFQKEFDLTVLAAVLTIIGYSINDTIVIFDRVRDNLLLRRGTDIEKVFNDSINETLSRTILTNMLVFMVLLSIWIFGGNRLEPFAFTLIVGSISGTYSTIYIAAPIVIWWTKRMEKRPHRA